MASAWDSSHAPSRHWQSGEWSIELRDDELAEIRYGGRRVLRSIRAVARDRNWATADLVVDRVRETDSTLTLHVRSVGLGSSFAGVVRVETRADRLKVVCDLESATVFQTNRTGLVVLHPPELAGVELAVTHAGGRVESSRFPVPINPHQPVFDIAGLAWRHDGLAAEVAFTGDVFEMEDQRNWSDASFKTYSRPLDLPFPYAVEAGERVRQEITVAVTDAAPAATPVSGSTTRIELKRGGTFPAILVGAATAPDPAPAATSVGQGVLVELDLGSSNWRAALTRATASGLPLDVRAVLARDAAGSTVDDLATALVDLPVLRVAIFDPISHVTDAAATASLRAALASAGLTVPVIGGARSHFTEYNREHDRIPTDLDGITVAITPLFHTLGTEQLVESVSIQRLIAEQTIAMAGGAPVHIGPVTVRPRFNPVATAAEPGPTRDDLAEGYGAEFTGGVDPRQSSPELAAWTIASAAALGIPGVASIAWFEEWGPRGIRSVAGDPLPAHDAMATLADMAASASDDLLSGDSPDGELWAIGAQSSTGSRVLVANIGRIERTVDVVTPDGGLTASLAPGTFAALTASP
ncbi:hypothetical protein [Microbacterium pumilum]|uniref:Uncharacterized protein n=1 Tax=Microbacterium pumilum TaxID=344165 RepID=A0ABN2RTT5_9MICO